MDKESKTTYTFIVGQTHIIGTFRTKVDKPNKILLSSGTLSLINIFIYLVKDY